MKDKERKNGIACKEAWESGKSGSKCPQNRHNEDENKWITKNLERKYTRVIAR
jgi:hypothetical protein